MSYRIITNILDDQLATIANLPVIVKENEELSRAVNTSTSISRTSYLRATLLPAITETLSVGLTGKDKFNGLYQVDVFIPTGDSHDGANWITDEIIKAFPKKTLITADGITLRVANHWRETSTQSTEWYITPVVIQWETYIERI